MTDNQELLCKVSSWQGHWFKSYSKLQDSKSRELTQAWSFSVWILSNHTCYIPSFQPFFSKKAFLIWTNAFPQKYCLWSLTNTLQVEDSRLFMDYHCQRAKNAFLEMQPGCRTDKPVTLFRSFSVLGLWKAIQLSSCQSLVWFVHIQATLSPAADGNSSQKYLTCLKHFDVLNSWAEWIHLPLLLSFLSYMCAF